MQVVQFEISREAISKKAAIDIVNGQINAALLNSKKVLISHEKDNNDSMSAAWMATDAITRNNDKTEVFFNATIAGANFNIPEDIDTFVYLGCSPQIDMIDNAVKSKKTVVVIDSHQVALKSLREYFNASGNEIEAPVILAYSNDNEVTSSEMVRAFMDTTAFADVVETIARHERQDRTTSWRNSLALNALINARLSSIEENERVKHLGMFLSRPGSIILAAAEKYYAHHRMTVVAQAANAIRAMRIGKVLFYTGDKNNVAEVAEIIFESGDKYDYILGMYLDNERAVIDIRSNPNTKPKTSAGDLAAMFNGSGYKHNAVVKRPLASVHTLVESIANQVSGK